MEVWAQAFPSSSDAGSGAVPTLTQLLQGERHHSRTSQDQGLLDNFHDLNKMIGRRYKRANGVSRNLLLKTLHLEPASTGSNVDLAVQQRVPVTMAGSGTVFA
ncbi:hypothetical protein NHX12_008587 [Muraenolepis orangiensis]|uniref:Uncharacterized protein n=1 Tax=Muraenolepis orangiensis TaxID=630683 RepID=A0A9Q0I872_9TELE|nr:hypothetical protein NHX12_008587 [Muraenolepis orangiensis]